MDISYVGGVTASVTASTATNTTISLTGLTGGSNSSPSANDMVFVYYVTGSTVSRAISIITTGYSTLRSDYGNDTVDVNTLLAAKRMGATPDTSVVVGPTLATTDGGVVIVQVFRGVGNGETVGAFLTTNTIIPNPATSVTPAQSGGWLLMAGGGAGTLAAGNAYTAAYLSNFLSLSNVAATNDPVAGMGVLTNWTSAYNGAAWTFTGTDSLSYAVNTYVRGMYPANNASMGEAAPASIPSPTTVVTSNGDPAPHLVLYKTVAANGSVAQNITLSTSGAAPLLPAYTADLSVQEGDLVVVATVNGGTAVVAVTTAGFGQYLTGLSNDTYDNRLGLYLKRMGATPDTSFDVAAPSTGFGMAVAVMVFRNARSSSPLLTSAVTAAINTAIPDPPPLSITSPHTIFVVASSADATGVGGLLSSAELGGFSSALSNGSSGANAIGAGVFGVLSGTVNPAALTYTGTGGTTSSALSYTFALANANEAAIASVDSGVPTPELPRVSQGNVPVQYIGDAVTLAAATGAAGVVSFASLSYRDPLYASILPDDLVVVYIATATNTADAGTILTSGYTTVFSGRANDTTDNDMLIAYKFMGATPDTQVAVSQLGATGRARVIGVQVYRYARSNTPVLVNGNVLLNTQYPVPLAASNAQHNMVALFAASANDAGSVGPITVTSGIPVDQVSSTLTNTLTINSLMAVIGGGEAAAPTLSMGALGVTGASGAIAATVTIVSKNYMELTGPTSGTPTHQLPSVGADGSKIWIVGQTAELSTLTASLTVDLTTLTGGLDSAPAAGDLVVAMVAVANGAAGTPNATVTGYDMQQRIAFASYEAGLFTKVMGATPDTSLTVNTVVGETAVKVFVLRNVDASPMDVVPTTASNGSGNIDAPAITPATRGALVFAFAEQRDGGIGVQGTATDYLKAWWLDTGSHAGWWAFYGLSNGSSTINPAILSGGGVNDWAAITFAVKPYIAPAGNLGYIKVWDGAAWVEKPVKVWNGSTWVQKPVKHWTGTDWV